MTGHEIVFTNIGHILHEDEERVSMIGPRTIPVLVNIKEHQADALLREVGKDYGDRLLTKVRLADAVDIGQWTQSKPSLLTYALKSHLDFLMVSEETSMPIFAVEIDGSQHYKDSRQRGRDRMKDQICKASGLPLLRVNSDFARREGKHVLLKYICDVYYRSLAFDKAQQAGYLPSDEPFIHFAVLDADSDGRTLFGSIEAKARVQLMQLYDAGKIAHYAPDTWYGESDEWGNLRVDAYLGAGNGTSLVGTATVRDFTGFGIGASTLAEELAVLHLRDEALRWANGEPAGWGSAEFQKHFTHFRDSMRPTSHSRLVAVNGERQVPYPGLRTPDITI